MPGCRSLGTIASSVHPRWVFSAGLLWRRQASCFLCAPALSHGAATLCALIPCIVPSLDLAESHVTGWGLKWIPSLVALKISALKGAEDNAALLVCLPPFCVCIPIAEEFSRGSTWGSLQPSHSLSLPATPCFRPVPPSYASRLPSHCIPGCHQMPFWRCSPFTSHRCYSRPTFLQFPSTLPHSYYPSHNHSATHQVYLT